MPDLTMIVATARGLWWVLAKFPLITGWLLRWRYPLGRCKQLLLIDLNASLARFELLVVRPSHALTSLRLSAHNHLPFDVTIDLYRIVVIVESYQLLDGIVNTQLVIPSSASFQTSMPEITLTEQQTKWVQELGRECTNVRVEVYCRCKSSIQNWEECRSFVFLSSINADRPSN